MFLLNMMFSWVWLAQLVWTSRVLNSYFKYPACFTARSATF